MSKGQSKSWFAKRGAIVGALVGVFSLVGAAFASSFLLSTPVTGELNTHTNAYDASYQITEAQPKSGGEHDLSCDLSYSRHNTLTLNATADQTTVNGQQMGDDLAGYCVFVVQIRNDSQQVALSFDPHDATWTLGGNAQGWSIAPASGPVTVQPGGFGSAYFKVTATNQATNHAGLTGSLKVGFGGIVSAP